MREAYFAPFATIGDAYVMTEAEQRALRNKMLALQKYHARCIHQLQWHVRHGILPNDPQFHKIEKRMRSLEKRIGSAQHRLAHVRIYDELIQAPEQLSFWQRLRQKLHSSRKATI